MTEFQEIATAELGPIRTCLATSSCTECSSRKKLPRPAASQSTTRGSHNAKSRPRDE
jgi:hypothetical protein